MTSFCVPYVMSPLEVPYDFFMCFLCFAYARKGSPHKFHMMSLCVAYVFPMRPPGVPSELILRSPAVTLRFPAVFFMLILRPPRGPSMIISLCSLCFSDGPPRGDLVIHYVLLMFLLCAPLAVAYDFLVYSCC